MISLKSKIYVAGHKGLVGSAIIRKLKQKGYKNIIFRSKKQLDLINQKQTVYKNKFLSLSTRGLKAVEAISNLDKTLAKQGPTTE